MALQPSNEPEEVKALECYVAGVKYRPFSVINELKTGSPVTLQAEPTNQYDENAIKVLSNNDLIGYIPKKHTWILHLLRKANVKLTAALTVNQFNRDEEKLFLRITFVGQNNQF